MPMYIAFIDLTKAFDLVSRDGLFQILPKISCPPKLQSMIESFHTSMKGTLQFVGSSSRPFHIRSGVKQGCVLAPTLFGIFFALLLRHTFRTVSVGIYMRIRSDDKLFSVLVALKPRQRFAKPSSETCCSHCTLSSWSSLSIWGWSTLVK